MLRILLEVPVVMVTFILLRSLGELYIRLGIKLMAYLIYIKHSDFSSKRIRVCVDLQYQEVGIGSFLDVALFHSVFLISG